MKTIAVIVAFVQGSLCFLAGFSVNAQEPPLVVYQGEPFSVGVLTITNSPDKSADEGFDDLSRQSILHLGDAALYAVMEPHRDLDPTASRRVRFLCRPVESVTDHESGRNNGHCQRRIVCPCRSS